jgi:hypothetical protein
MGCVTHDAVMAAAPPQKNSRDSFGVLVFWCSGVLVFWCSGVLVFWCSGVLVFSGV